MTFSIKNVDYADSVFNATIGLEFDSGLVSTFHWIYLLDNCTSTESLHPETKQRLIDVFNGSEMRSQNGFEDANKAIGGLFDDIDFDIINGNLVCRWSASSVSEFSQGWLLTHSYSPQLFTRQQQLPDIQPWNAAEFGNIVRHGKAYKFDQIQSTLPDLLQDIYKYGFQFVENVPVSLEATQKISESISIIRPTHYDLGVWDFTSDMSKNDTAYTTLAIDMHTDGNYWHEPPGLQLFHLLEHSGGTGGETRIVDVARVVRLLQDLSANDKTWSRAYQILTTQPIAFHQAGEEGMVFIKNSFPVLTVSESGQLLQCRWNNSDRSPQFPKLMFSVGQIYEALFRFNALINDPKNFVQLQLMPGKILVFDNWRILHARNSFTGYRRLCGSYLTRDDFLARLRSSYNQKDALLNAL
ncbi:LAME_0E11386g1_1 [Lachancea meyersii CBS 8951]|uniref:LAME_0E11386g1_1 n=1 Tax=Lachancea meyersii CBS 8951 TaxID=1266667 RepID=A0A1G4JKT8_9SACH|nr:LAME_0E11386g1_1 [Lachancea meyersii CBS 8951]